MDRRGKVFLKVFENVLDPSRQPGRRFGAGAVVTVLVHVAAVALVVWLSSRPVEAEATPAEVKFFSGVPSPLRVAAPPPAAAQAPTQPKVEEKKPEKRPKKPQEIVAPREIPVEKPKEAEPEAAPPEPEPDPQPAGEPGGVSAGIEGGKSGGTEGGSALGVVGGTGTGTEVVSFGEGMTRPEHIKHPPEFQCPREAREAQVEGVLLASCTVTLDGWLRDCKIIKPLPHLDEVALDLLQRWRVGPVYFQGKPVLVNYKIPIRMVCK
jgi:periplasmic protein TonB